MAAAVLMATATEFRVSPYAATTPSDKHFAVVVGLVPGYPDHRRQGDERQDQTVRQPRGAGVAAGRGSTALEPVGAGCALPARVLTHGQIQGRHGAAHKLARLIYAMLTKGVEYTDQGHDYYEERYRQRMLLNLSGAPSNSA